MLQKKSGDGTDILVAKAEQTEIGHFIIEHFRIIVAVIVLLVAGIGGYAGYRYFQNNQNGVAAEAVFQFENGSWKSYGEGKIKIDELMSVWEKIDKQYGKSEAIIPTAMDVSQELVAKNQLNEAMTILKPLHERFKSNPYFDFFIGHQLSVIYDDLGKDDEAIVLLEGMVASKVSLLKAKLYFDLGRICKRKGDNEKAKRYFEYLIAHYGGDANAKMAKVYLREIK